jgi:hypothetical protein
MKEVVSSNRLIVHTDENTHYFLLFILLSLTFVAKAQEIVSDCPADPEPFEIEQPDKSVLKVRFVGTLSNHHMEAKGNSALKQVEIIDLSGKLINQYSSTRKSDSKMELNVTNLKSGIYILKVYYTGSDTVDTYRILKN